MRRRLFTILAGLTLLGSGVSYGQTTVTFTGADHDAMVANGGLSQINYGSQNQMSVGYDAGQQVSTVFRSFLQYDLSSIPANAVIVSATLDLHANTVDNTVDHPYYVERVSEASWDESTLTWSNQPEVWTSDKISIPHADLSSTGTHSLDVTDHVQIMVHDSARNYGWRIRLQQESPSSSTGVQYATTDVSNSSKHPKLTVEYILPLEFATTINHCTVGNDDGDFSITLSQGSTTNTTSNIFFYETIRDTTKAGEASLNSVKTTHNVQYDTTTKTVTATGLEPGIYVLRVIDDAYYSAGNDTRFIFYRHILVGREGETTTGVLLPDYRYQENTAIHYDKPTNSSPINRANTNYYTHTSSITLHVNDVPNSRESASLIQYKMDFDSTLEFSQADLRISAFSKFFRGSSSSNETNVSRITSPWEKRVVTWNTRPGIDSTSQVNIPTTTAIGFDNDHTADTISILPFVSYWQEEPDSNYGVEAALVSYNQTQLADRSYRSARKNVHFLELAFTVKVPIRATYDEELQTGDVIVNAPGGYDLPYKYLISYEPLPSLDSIWQTVKDSIPVDSTTFFAGDVASRNFAFENLEPQRYFVGVYDNTGAKIMDETVVLSPAISLLSSTNLDYTSDTLKRGASASDGTAQIDGLILENGRGGFEFQITELGGNFLFGFNNYDEALPTTDADFEYSFEFFADNTFDVLKGDSILFEGTTALESRFRIHKENNQIIYYRDAYELFRTPIAIEERAALTGAVVFRTGLGSVSYPIKYDNFKPLARPIKVKTPTLECGDQTGVVSLGSNGFGFAGGSGSYSIEDRATDLVVASGTLDGTGAASETLPVGKYRVYITYTVGATTYSYYEYFQVGFQIYWNILNDHFTAIDGTVNTIKASGTLEMGEAISQNTLLGDEEGWINYYQRFHRYYPPFGSPAPFAASYANMRMVKENTDLLMRVRSFNLGSGIISKYIWVHDESGVVHGTPFITSLDGPIDIERNEVSGDYEYAVYFNNAGTPFATLTEDVLADPEKIRAYPEARNASIYDAYASFCSGTTLSSHCAHLDYELDGNYYITNSGLFCFVYEEEYNDPNIQFNIYNDAQYLIANQDDFETEDLIYGENRVVLDLTDEGFCLGRGMYILEVINDKRERFYLRFYNDNNTCTPYYESGGVVISIDP